VASVLARSASATGAPSRSAMTPEPTTVATSSNVPMPSATARRRSSASVAIPRHRRGRLLGAAQRRAAGRSLRRGRRLWCSDVALHHEHFPLVAIRVLDPDLVLHGVAAGDVVLAERAQ